MEKRAEELHRALGSTIRSLRQARGLTLVQLAEAAALSHPFLSQLERGLARPSMGSLHRIADALGTTQQALLSMPSSTASADGQRIGVVRRAEGVVVDAPGGRARAVVSGARGLHATEFDGMAREYVDDDYYAHPGEEMIYVIAGLVEVDFADDEAYSLAAGDTITYPGTLPHRARSLSDEPVRLLLVQQGSKPAVDGAETVTWM